MTDEKPLMVWFEEMIRRKIEESIYGVPKPNPRPTALRLRGNGFETVELDGAGNVIEPAPRCCNGVVLHEPNCKYWLTIS